MSSIFSTAFVALPYRVQIARRLDIKMDTIRLGPKLGQGGFGIVYKAEWEVGQRAVHSDVATGNLCDCIGLQVTRMCLFVNSASCSVTLASKGVRPHTCEWGPEWRAARNLCCSQ